MNNQSANQLMLYNISVRIKQLRVRLMGKTLSVAFVWHMHQPLYKDHLTGKYLMPWVRLHAIKDYLDMVLILKKFPKIRQTFNLVPSLIEQINDYAYKNAQDPHSLLTIKPENEFTDDEKVFILERFFDANYKNMIAPYGYYNSLYQRSTSAPPSNLINTFSNQEYADIVTWFNLVWFDPMWKIDIPYIADLFKQERNFSLEQRTNLIGLQREILRKIIPTYKEYQDKGQIEVTTTPYYHPILPLLIDTEAAKVARPSMNLPQDRFNHIEDAWIHLKKSVESYRECFGRDPKGIWPSEQSVSPETIKLIADAGFKWAISDEGVLASTLGKEFRRNFYGNLEEPKDLTQPYNINIDGKSVNMIFRNVLYSDLIGFHFGRMDSRQAAWELYDRIKDVQQKLFNSSDNHLLTIALDGENCWESYPEDGNIFLEHLYHLLSEEEHINVTTVSEYLESSPPARILNTIHSGSWINRDFHIWIGDPAKNTGWTYLKKTRDDLVSLISKNKYNEEIVKKAWEELYIAEGSDWFWWYGDPNVSAQDDLFDEQFRLHLQNVYKVLDHPIPSQLFVPVEVYLGRSLRYPSSEFLPIIDDITDSEEEWLQAGCIDMSFGAIYQSDKIIRRVWFGSNKNNLHLRLDTFEPIHDKDVEIFFYAYNPGKVRHNSPIRLRTAQSTISETLKFKYAYEASMCISAGHGEILFSESIENSLWKLKENSKSRLVLGSTVEVSIPFDELNVYTNEEIHFSVMAAKKGVCREVIPENSVLVAKRL